MENTKKQNTTLIQEQEKRPSKERVRPDLNLEKWSLWQPAKSKNKKTRILRREIENAQGDKITAEVTIGYIDRIGTLTTEDQKTFYSFVQLWNNKGRSIGVTHFSSRALARIRKKGWGTNVIDAMSQSAVRLRAVPVIFTNAYYDSTKKETFETLDTFNILSDLKIIKRSKDGHITKEEGYFKFNEFILNNLLNGYTKPILLEVVLSFKSEIAQLLYTHLDLIMARRDHYERRTRELFFDDLGLESKEYMKASSRTRKLKNAIKELQGIELSTGYITSIKLERTKDDTDYKIVVDKGQQQQLALIAEADPAESREVQLTEPQQPSTLGKQARDLVAYFHKLFHGAELSHPSSKAINQATVLVARYGDDLARSIVDFAHIEAPKTHFNLQTFGGILQYTARALAEIDQARAKEKNHTLIDQCTFCDRNGFIFFEDERGYSTAAKCPHNLDTIKAKAEARNWHHPKLSLTTTLDLPTTPTP